MSKGIRAAVDNTISTVAALTPTTVYDRASKFVHDAKAREPDELQEDLTRVFGLFTDGSFEYAAGRPNAANGLQHIVFFYDLVVAYREPRQGNDHQEAAMEDVHTIIDGLTRPSTFDQATTGLINRQVTENATFDGTLLTIPLGLRVRIGS